jgi:HAD superfamily hydrolase (TIGR01509 family)
MCADLETVWPGAGSAEDLLRIKRGRYRRLAVERCELTPGVAEAIERLARRSPLAVATSSSLGDIEPILQRYELRGFFTAILTIESVERPKPDPQIYHMAAERLNREPSRCWVFEDSPRGMEAARRSGARAIAVTTTFGSDALAPHCASIADFLDADRIETLLF